MEPIIFVKAGKIMVTPFNSDGTLDIANKSVGMSSVVESVKPTIAPKTQDLPDGNSDWAAGTVSVGVDGKLQVTFTTYSPELHAALIGQTVASTTNQTMWALGVDYTIDAAAGTITLAQTPAAGTVPIVKGIDGTTYTKVASGPTTGQFSITGAVLTFATGDKGKPVKVSYQRTAATGNEFGLPVTSTLPALNVVIDGQAQNVDGTSVSDVNILIDKAVVDGNIDLPEMKRAPGSWTVTFKVIKPRGGFKPVDVLFAADVAV
jgi:hypothetical protein